MNQYNTPHPHPEDGSFIENTHLSIERFFFRKPAVGREGVEMIDICHSYLHLGIIGLYAHACALNVSFADRCVLCCSCFCQATM